MANPATFWMFAEKFLAVEISPITALVAFIVGSMVVLLVLYYTSDGAVEENKKLSLKDLEERGGKKIKQRRAAKPGAFTAKTQKVEEHPIARKKSASTSAASSSNMMRGGKEDIDDSDWVQVKQRKPKSNKEATPESEVTTSQE